MVKKSIGKITILNFYGGNKPVDFSVDSGRLMCMKIRRNIFLFKLNCFFGNLWPLSALAIVYFEQITGSYATALGVFSVANVVQCLVEVPTGIISDKIGRRRTMISSAFIFFLSFVAFAMAGTLALASLLLVGGVLWGIAEAFRSGTDDALMYETMQQLRKENKYDIVYARSKSFSQIGLATGALLAALVTYFYSLNILAWVSTLPALGQAIVTLFFVEPNTYIKEEKSSFKHFLAAWKDLCKNRKLQILAIIQMLNKGIGYPAYRLEGVYFNMLIPTWMVNITRVIKQLSGAISFSITPYIRKLGFFKILLLSSIGNVLIRSVGVVLNNFASPFIISLVNLFYGSETTAESALLQKELSQKQRATMGSIVSLVGGLFKAIMYYVIGLIADAFSIYFAIVLLIVCKAVVGGAYYWMLRKYR